MPYTVSEKADLIRHCKRLGLGDFSVCGPIIWKSFPQALRLLNTNNYVQFPDIY